MQGSVRRMVRKTDKIYQSDGVIRFEEILSETTPFVVSSLLLCNCRRHCLLLPLHHTLTLTLEKAYALKAMLSSVTMWSPELFLYHSKTPCTGEGGYEVGDDQYEECFGHFHGEIMGIS